MTFGVASERAEQEVPVGQYRKSRKPHVVLNRGRHERHSMYRQKNALWMFPQPAFYLCAHVEFESQTKPVVSFSFHNCKVGNGGVTLKFSEEESTSPE